MADTKKINVRLVRGFDHPRGHRRGGIQFIAGPQAQTIEVNPEQLKAIEADPSLEIVSGDVAKKSMTPMTDEQIGQTKDQQDVSKVIGEPDTGDTPQTRRRYITDDPTRAESPEADATTAVLERSAQVGEYTPRPIKTPPKAPVKTPAKPSEK